MATTRIVIDNLDTLLLDSSSDERNESVRMLQHLDDITRENEEWQQRDEEEARMLQDQDI